MTETKKGLSANALKYIAVIAMTIDHIGWDFVSTASILGQLMHFIGRLTAPIMCYFIAEGYYKTSNLNKYFKRLGIFAIISHFPFVFDNIDEKPFQIINGTLKINTEVYTPIASMIFTLFLGLWALKIWNSNSKYKKLSIFFICLLSIISDWMYFGVLWILIFGIYRGNIKKQLKFYYIIALISIITVLLANITSGGKIYEGIWQCGVLIAPLFILLYNGKRGSSHPFHKWFFYVYYPLHLLIISIVKFYII